MLKLCIKSYPKLNIFLQILNRRSDGFHTIASRFVLAKGALFDTIHIQKGNMLSIDGDFGCETPNNTIYKAILALKEVLINRLNNSKSPTPHLNDSIDMVENLHITAEKKIPKGAGLGGGSSNAGAVINAFCAHFELTLSNAEILHIAQKSGADVAFFLHCHTSANVSGVGEVVEEFNEEDLTFEIFTPSIACNTPLVYQTLDEMVAKKLARYADSKQSRDLLALKSEQILRTHTKENLNGLYIAALHAYPQLAQVARDLGDEWFFSGSGSSFFRLAR